MHLAREASVTSLDRDDIAALAQQVRETIKLSKELCARAGRVRAESRKLQAQFLERMARETAPPANPDKVTGGEDKMNSAAASACEAEAQLRSFIEKFDSANQALIKAVRKALRERLPAANELVYDNYNFFVIGYSASERPSDAVLSLVADRNGVRLAFPYTGAKLPDPRKLLRGSGTQNRALTLESAERLRDPEVEALIAASLKVAKTAMPESGKGELMIRSISPKQRPRR